MKLEKLRNSSLGKLYHRLSSPKRKDDQDSLQPASTLRQDPDQQLLVVFEHLDGDGNGKVSAEELRMSVGTLSEEEAEEAVRMWDTDGDGMLDFGEFQKLLGVGEKCSDERDDLRAAFEMYTGEGSERITPDSLRRTLSRLGERRSIEDCKGMIRAFDVDGDGLLSFDEFIVMMQ